MAESQLLMGGGRREYGRATLVAVDGKPLTGQPTGVGRVLGGVLGALPALSDPGVELRLLTPPTGARTLPWVLWGLPLQARGADVLHCPFYYRPVIAPCPTVVEIYDILVLTHPEWFSRSGRWPFGWLVKRSISRASCVITAARCVLQEIDRRFGPLGGRGVVLPLGVDRRQFAPASEHQKQRVRRRHGTAAPYLLHVGSLQPRRGLDTAIEALAMLRRRRPDLELVVVGKTEHDWVGRDQMVAGVRRLGYVDEDDLAPLMSGAACVLALSRGEGFDLPLLEALACGAPVVASDIPPHREHFAPWAELVPVGDAAAVAARVDEVLAGSGVHERGHEQAREVHASFRWEHAAQARLEVWRRVARARRSP